VIRRSSHDATAQAPSLAEGPSGGTDSVGGRRGLGREWRLFRDPEALTGLALKATIYKAQLQIADMDRQLYADHGLTLALHPSETEERLLVRLLAFALQVPHDDHRGALQFARGLSDADEPDLWQHDLSGQLVHWIEVGLPDDRRLSKACAKAERVTLYVYGASVPVWWSGIENKLSRLNNLSIWHIPIEQSQALAALAQRSMQWQLTIQDGQIWLHGNDKDIEITPRRLRTPAAER
jgi:uncharacterized protein YaeQ